jgi:hypothetical protein
MHILRTKFPQIDSAGRALSTMFGILKISIAAEANPKKQVSASVPKYRYGCAKIGDERKKLNLSSTSSMPH